MLIDFWYLRDQFCENKFLLYSILWKYKLDIPNLLRCHIETQHTAVASPWSIVMPPHNPCMPEICTLPLFTERPELVLQNLVQHRSRGIGCYNDHVALQFDRQLHSAAAEVTVRLQSDWKSLIRISQIRYLTRSCGNTCVRSVNGSQGTPRHICMTFYMIKSRTWK